MPSALISWCITTCSFGLWWIPVSTNHQHMLDLLDVAL